MVLADDNPLTSVDRRQSAGLAQIGDIETNSSLSTEDKPMPTLSFIPTSSPTEAAWPRGGNGFPTDCASGDGYGFETALCMIESQSPRLRPPADDIALRDIAESCARHSRALSMRTALLETLLGGVEEHLRAGQRRALRATALLVVDELIATLGPDAHRRATDPTISVAERFGARDSLTAAQRLAERLRAALHPFSPGIVWC
jgi:hypothetical protein